jgi:hypothetical protein
MYDLRSVVHNKNIDTFTMKSAVVFAALLSTTAAFSTQVCAN